MLIMSLLEISISSVQYVITLLEDVLNMLNEVVPFVSFRQDMNRNGLSSHKWHSYFNGTQWLESHTHLKGKALIPCAWMIWIVHAQNVYNHPIDDLYLAISLGMVSSGLGELGVQHWPEAGPKCAEEPAVTIWYDRLWDTKVHPHSFKEEFSSGFCCDILFVGYHNGHLWEYIDDHENIVVSMLSRRKVWHVIHGNGFPRSIRGRKQSIEALILDG